MYRKSFRGAVAGSLVMIMVATAFFVPGAFDSGKSYAAEREANYNKLPTLGVPKTIYANKAFNVTVYGDPAPTDTTDKSLKAYIAQTFSVKRNGKVLRGPQMLNGATATTIRDIKLSQVGAYTFNIYYTIMAYDTVTNEWKQTGTHNYDYNFNAIGKIKIKFNRNKGKFAKGSIKSKTVTTGKKYGKLATLKKRSGYKFMGWFTAKTGGYKVTSKSYVNLKKDSTLYAQWKYKIKFNANKGKVSSKSKSVTSGKKYGKLPTPKRSGYTFKGWFTKKKGGSKLTKSSYVAKVSKHTLYAQWTKKSSGSTGTANSPYVTQAEYNKITRGMTYTEVCNIVGGSGKFIVRTAGGMTYQWYTDSTEKKFVSVHFYESSITGKKTVNSKRNNCGW